MLGISLVAAGLFYLPMAIVREPWQLALLQALLGVAAGGLIPSANALIAHLTPVERRGAVFGLTAALSGLGGFAGPLLGAGLATTLGFRSTFIAAGALLLALAALVVGTRAATEMRSRGLERPSRQEAPGLSTSPVALLRRSRLGCTEWRERVAAQRAELGQERQHVVVPRLALDLAIGQGEDARRSQGE